VLVDAYDEEMTDKETRVVLHIKPELAPIKVAILPLSRNDKLLPLSKQVSSSLRPHFMTQYDDAQSIGRRYRRQDEIGTPYCVTIDFQSLEDQQVTIRDRDSMQQERVPVPELRDALKAKFER
jgi:glycyl-tRNA synthetase